MALTYIGYGTTDANGIAKLDHDANGNSIDGYTGTGEGNISFVASTEQTPSQSSIMSNRVEVYDAPTTYAVSLSLSSSTVYIGTQVTLTATVTEDGESIGSGKTVTFKKGATTLGTGTTDSNGVATYNYTTNTAGEFSITASYNVATSTASTLTVNKINTSLNINVPQIIYSDSFYITGQLIDANTNQPIHLSQINLKIKWTVDGTTYESSSFQYDMAQTTFTFVRNAPTTISEYSFWVEFNGNDTYNNSSSSVETRTPSKETSVLTVNYPVNNASYYYDGMTVSGTLLSNDGEVMPSKSVLVKEGDTLIKTLTTDSNGAFTGVINSLATGSHNLTITFEEDTYYNGSTASRSVTLTKPSLISNKSILSYADEQQTPGSEVATLTATFSSSGKTVKLYKASDDSEVGTMTDNDDGTYSYDYTSTGVGDVSFYAKYTEDSSNFVSEIYELHDIYYYDSGATNKSSHYDISNRITINNANHGSVSISNDGEWYTMTTTGVGNYTGIPIIPITSINQAFVLTAKFEPTTAYGFYVENNDVLVAHGSTSNNMIRMVKAHKSQNVWQGINSASNLQLGTENTFELISNNGSITLKVYNNGSVIYNYTTSIASLNNTSNTVHFGIITYNNTLKFKEVSVKLL